MMYLPMSFTTLAHIFTNLSSPNLTRHVWINDCYCTCEVNVFKRSLSCQAVDTFSGDFDILSRLALALAMGIMSVPVQDCSP